MEERMITIIEGPPPTFEEISEGWVLGLSESPHPAQLALTRLRTFNGQELVERCYRAWHKKELIQLEYRQSDGLISEVPIVAARNVKTTEGDMLLLWVRLGEKFEIELGYEDDDGFTPD